MSNILLTAGAKGGTGKSTAAPLLITYLRQHGADPVLLDLADENRTLSRFFPEALQVEIKKESSHDILVERALDGSSLILADSKASTRREMLDWCLTDRDSYRSESSSLRNLHKKPGRITQSERDWAYARRALARGDSRELVIAAIASYGRFGKPNPKFYAELTVEKAEASPSTKRATTKSAPATGDR